MEDQGPFKVTVGRIPNAFDPAVHIMWPSPYSQASGPWGNVTQFIDCKAHINFEPYRLYYAKHLLAIPSMLFAHAIRIFLYDLKRVWRGEPSRPVETVVDFNARIEAEKQPPVQYSGEYTEGMIR